MQLHPTYHLAGASSLPLDVGYLLTATPVLYKKRWQEYTEELYKEELHDPNNNSGVITHLKPVILKCKVKWALGSITMTKLMEVMEFHLSYFKS